MTESKVQRKNKELKILDQSTQELLFSIKKTNHRVAYTGFMFLTALFIIGVLGIYKQIEIANTEKEHIDCIVQLFRTHTQNPNDRRYITTLNQCHIEIVKGK